jgi:ribosome biogenesis GTPase
MEWRLIMIAKKHTDTIFSKDLVQSLSKMGWTSSLQTHMNDFYGGNRLPARVVGVNKNSFCVSQGETEFLATVSGRLTRQADCQYPVVGDWVIISDTVIYAVLPRKNALSRGASGSRGKQKPLPRREQVIAANLDAVFIVCGLDRDFNIRRIERYVTLVYNCGLNPVIILTKADLHPDPGKFISEVEPVSIGVPVHMVSAKDSIGLVQLEKYLSPGQTITMIGSSGSGKSTLVNRLYGKTVQATGPVSESVGKGKHTTTSRDLIMMPQGGLVIDNPGIREIAFWDCDGGIGLTFPEIENLASECRFSDCSHMHEPGCRVIKAVTEGEIVQERLESFHKMKRELMYLSDRQHKSANRVEKERWKEVALKIKDIKKGY